MTPSTAPSSASAADLAAAKARHPARPAGAPRPDELERQQSPRLRGGRDELPLRFAEAAALLSGPWRVTDPVGFAAAMTTGGAIAGHPVTDLSTTAGDDLVATLAGIAPRPRLGLWWVAGSVAGQLHVEARAEAPACRQGPEIFVLAHLVEPLGTPGSQMVPADHSWVVVIVGDGSGGVAAIARATLACPRRPRCCPPPVTAARFPLAALKARLLSPALEAEDASSRPTAAVLALPSRA